MSTQHAAQAGSQSQTLVSNTTGSDHNAISLPHGTRQSAAIQVIGACSLAIVLAGGPIAMIPFGFGTPQAITAGLKSRTYELTIASGAIVGLIVAIAAAMSYRKLPTRRSRDQVATAGALGTEAVLAGGILLWFASGNVSLFAQNFLDFHLLRPYVSTFLDGAKNTLILAISSQILGMTLGIVVSILLISPLAVVRAPARVFVNFMRGTPPIWQLAIMYFGISLGMHISLDAYTAAILVFTLHVSAYSAEVYRAGYQSIERSQMEAARGLGLSYFGAMAFVILPQMFRRVIPPLLNQVMDLVKGTSLVLVIGLTASQADLYTAGQIAYGQTYNATFFLAVGLGYLVITIPLMSIVGRIERRMREGLRGVG